MHCTLAASTSRLPSACQPLVGKQTVHCRLLCRATATSNLVQSSNSEALALEKLEWAAERRSAATEPAVGIIMHDACMLQGTAKTLPPAVCLTCIAGTCCRALTQRRKGRRVWQPVLTDPPPLLQDVTIILVSPKRPVSVGTVARACACFECEDLRIVQPCCDRLARSSRNSSKGAQALLWQAQDHDLLQSALAGVDFSVACTRWMAGKHDSGTVLLRWPRHCVAAMPLLVRCHCLFSLTSGWLVQGGPMPTAALPSCWPHRSSALCCLHRRPWMQQLQEVPLIRRQAFQVQVATATAAAQRVQGIRGSATSDWRWCLAGK